MAAFRDQHRVGDLLASPHAADESVRGAVESHGDQVADGDDFAQFARVDDLFDPDEIGVITQDVAHADDHSFAAGRLFDSAAFGKGLCDRFFEQHVVTGLDGFHAGFEMLVLGGGDQHGVGREGIFEKTVVVRETPLRLQPESLGGRAAAYFVDLHHTREFQPFGVPDCVFEVFVGAVPGSDGNDRNRFRVCTDVHSFEVCRSGRHSVASSGRLSRLCLRSIRAASLILSS